MLFGACLRGPFGLSGQRRQPLLCSCARSSLPTFATSSAPVSAAPRHWRSCSMCGCCCCCCCCCCCSWSVPNRAARVVDWKMAMMAMMVTMLDPHPSWERNPDQGRCGGRDLSPALHREMGSVWLSRLLPPLRRRLARGSSWSVSPHRMTRSRAERNTERENPRFPGMPSSGSDQIVSFCFVLSFSVLF